MCLCIRIHLRVKNRSFFFFSSELLKMGDNSGNEEGTNSDMEMGNLSLQANRLFPRDLLQGFVRRSDFGDVKMEEDEDVVELNLGLSLGGKFGVDRPRGKLVRSSSIAGFFPPDSGHVSGSGRDAGAEPGLEPDRVGLTRTSSLPVETEEEWRKRKEMQTLRRLAVKRRRSEKQRRGGGVERDGNEEGREQYVAAMNRVGSSSGPPPGLPMWLPGRRPGDVTDRVGSMAIRPGPCGSGESQVGSCSSMSELESRPHQGSSSCGETSPSVLQATQDPSNQEASGSSRPRTQEIDKSSRNQGRGTGPSSREDMPCVFTVGDGPNGRKIEGILYRYGKGEEVKIMCICHGNFHSPAEFVKHAGGSNVAHPLKHIVVNPNASPFL